MAPAGDAAVVERLREGDEATFTDLVDRYQGPLLRLARSFVPSREIAEEVVQDTWVGVLRGVDAFEGRSSLKTWIFRILKNLARTRGVRERRMIPFSSVTPEGEASWLLPENNAGPSWTWVHHARPWSAADPHVAAEGSEALRAVLRALRGLPPRQRAVVALRDLYLWSSREVCEALDLSETYQRVLLHRGRLKLREALG